MWQLDCFEPRSKLTNCPYWTSIQTGVLSPLKLRTGLSVSRFPTWNHASVRSPPRWKHRYSSGWKILLKLISWISLWFRKATWKGFPTHCTFGSLLLVPMKLGEVIRVDHVVQIILQAGGIETHSRWILNKPSISILHPNLPTQKYIWALLVQSLKKVLTAVYSAAK